MNTDRQIELRCKQHAAIVYKAFTQSERACVRFGMFPAEKMQEAESFLSDEMFIATGDAANRVDLARYLAVGVMDEANRGPNKMVV
jgi:hypothetical protein